MLTAKFWQYDAKIGRWWNVDPVDQISVSNYACFLNNPILLVDPLGDSTFVELQDGKYVVKGGALNNNNGIYMHNKKGESVLIGYSATPESFYYSEAEKFMGEIDPKDFSGDNFIKNTIVGDHISLTYYLATAFGGRPNDFKVTNGDSKKYSKSEEHYRGMPLTFIVGDKLELPVYGSARDVGNIAAGIVAGRNDMNWTTARLGYDALQKIQQGVDAVEGSSTQYAQRLGFLIGKQLYEHDRSMRLSRYSIPYVRKNINHKILKQNEFTPSNSE